MTAAEFTAWMQGRGLTDETAGALLRARRQEVWRWRTGKRPVPNRVSLLAHLLDDARDLPPDS